MTTRHHQQRAFFVSISFVQKKRLGVLKRLGRPFAQRLILLALVTLLASTLGCTLLRLEQATYTARHILPESYPIIIVALPLGG